MGFEADTYRTLAKPSEEILLKERKSKFYGHAYPIQSEEVVKPIIEMLRKQYANAGHVCYAWQLGIEQTTYRVSDDGEPNNSAGMPIYGQIKAFGLTNVLVTVTRVFGGTKLGVGGLIQAYKTAAQMALENSETLVKTLETSLRITFAYSDMEKVMRIVKKHGLGLVSQKMELDCEFEISCRKKMEEKVVQLFDALPSISIHRK